MNAARDRAYLEKRLAQGNAWRRKHRSRVNARRRAAYRANPQNTLARNRTWWLKHREECNAKQWAKYQANPEPVFHKRREYRKKNRRRINANRAARYRLHREQLNAKRRARYAELRAFPQKKQSGRPPEKERLYRQAASHYRPYVFGFRKCARLLDPHFDKDPKGSEDRFRQGIIAYLNKTPKMVDADPVEQQGAPARHPKVTSTREYNARQRARYQKDRAYREKKRARSLGRYAAKREAIRAQQRAYYARNPERHVSYSREYRQKHGPGINARARARYRKDRAYREKRLTRHRAVDAKRRAVAAALKKTKADPGRPPEKEQMYRRSARLYRPNVFGYRKCAKLLDPEFKKDPDRATDRMRVAIQRYLASPEEKAE